MDQSDGKMSVKNAFETHLNSSLLLLNYERPDFDVGEMIFKCHNLSASNVWLGIKVASLTLGLPLNIAFFWLLMLSKTALSAYEVLCFNLALTNMAYSLALPIDIYSTIHRPTEESLSVAEALSIFNIFSCPLLLASMCLERCIAVVSPQTYQLLRKSNYRMWYSVLVWLLSVIVAFVVYFHGILSNVLPLAAVIGVLFGLGLLGLLGIVYALSCKGVEPQEEDDVPEPKAALINVLAILLPFAAAYFPFLALEHFLTRFHAEMQLADLKHCHFLQILITIPNLGILTGPVLYLPGAVKRVCCSKKEENSDQTD